jgi:hypothetical protein
MTIIKRCEKEVPGSWADKQLQARTWLGHFVPHYTGRCSPVAEDVDRCPAKHSTVDSDDDSKKWLDIQDPSDQPRIAALEQLIDRIKADVTLYVHGYNTCAVECAHSERTVLTSKRIEYWRQWEGKCRLMQLLHNHRTTATGESLLQQLGWQMADGVSAHLGRIDRDKAKHNQLKTTPKYNARQKALRLEKREREATDTELIAWAAALKEKAREKQRHKYHAKKRLLYEAEEMKKGGEAAALPAVVEGEAVTTQAAEVTVVKRKRGRPRKQGKVLEESKVEGGEKRTQSGCETGSVATAGRPNAVGGGIVGTSKKRGRPSTVKPVERENSTPNITAPPRSSTTAKKRRRTNTGKEVAVGEKVTEKSLENHMEITPALLPLPTANTGAKRPVLKTLMMANMTVGVRVM